MQVAITVSACDHFNYLKKYIYCLCECGFINFSGILLGVVSIGGGEYVYTESTNKCIQLKELMVCINIRQLTTVVQKTYF